MWLVRKKKFVFDLLQRIRNCLRVHKAFRRRSNRRRPKNILEVRPVERTSSSPAFGCATETYVFQLTMAFSRLRGTESLASFSTRWDPRSQGQPASLAQW